MYLLPLPHVAVVTWMLRSSQKKALPPKPHSGQRKRCCVRDLSGTYVGMPRCASTTEDCRRRGSMQCYAYTKSQLPSSPSYRWTDRLSTTRNKTPCLTWNPSIFSKLPLHPDHDQHKTTECPRGGCRSVSLQSGTLPHGPH